ncbi:MAG TPA: D-alanyl-D-alanine carboxypeptidase/D-alanyl-D-alanine-endopeptidase [Bacteroidales bacterium]|nr:D-alanyl-D-alanine carboxypeptidase/D-alanyl-D-alanine-endopeptidase [Bacteroidales bacterium]
MKNQNNTIINETLSPPLNEIIEVLNHESINLYAEHLVKELGKAFRENGSASAGLEVINDFLKKNGIYNPGMVIIDGSGLSPRNLVNASGIVSLLLYMKNSNNYAHFINSLPEAGAEGTLKNVFRGPEFEGRLNAKSGSMAGIRSYAGYLKSVSGKELVFCIIVNNYSGSSGNVTRYIEEILKEAVVNN